MNWFLQEDQKSLRKSLGWTKCPNMYKCVKYCIQVRNYRGVGGARSPLSFFTKLEKIALIFGENALVAVIYVLNFSFKMQFLRISRRKYRRFFSLRGLPFSCCTWMLIKVPYFLKNSTALKISCSRTWLLHL